MQFTFDLGGPGRLAGARERLLAQFGPMRPMEPQLRLDPLSQMVRSSLGCRTRDEVSRAAFARLARRYRDWGELAEAPMKKVAELIADVEFAQDKAQHLIQALRSIKAKRGRLSLDFLADGSVEEAHRWLTGLAGVGPKVAAATLNFSSLRRRIFVVDTHIWRVSRRFGLIGPRTDPDVAHAVLMDQVPADWQADDLCELHWLLKRLGQDVCMHDHLRCRKCPLDDVCPGPRAPRGGWRGRRL